MADMAKWMDRAHETGGNVRELRVQVVEPGSLDSNSSPIIAYYLCDLRQVT